MERRGAVNSLSALPLSVLNTRNTKLSNQKQVGVAKQPPNL